MKTLFISYHSDVSPSTYYHDCSIRIKERIEKLNGRIYIEQLPTLGSYAANCLRKPEFILNCLNKFEEPVIWIDIDSIINSLPVEMDCLNVDVACVEKPNGCPESALIYFNNTQYSKNFLNKWIAGCLIQQPELDHPVLKELWATPSENEQRKSFSHEVCSVKRTSKVVIVLSSTSGKKEITKAVMDRRKKEGKII